ncbi:MAG: putative pterin-4-alpha-carbinolamine dehydratase [Bacteroidota bacterium]|jgi:4a-hydroxytetrahydrobiopterin dehydratase
MWTEENNKLYRKYQFRDFNAAFSFMTSVAMLAEKADHHPTWTNTWNTVEIWLSTHDAGNVVTQKDRDLAAEIDAIIK